MMKAAVIGAGHIAQQHLRCLSRMPGVELAGVCDLSRTMAECAADRYKVRAWYTDAAAMLRETKPDVVHITTPASSHFALAGAALDGGAHVIVEKPITTTLADTQTLCDKALAAKRYLIEDHNYLFNGTMLEIQSLIASGQLGQVVHVEVGICLNILGEGSRFADPNLPHPAIRQPGGAFSDFFTHMAYLVYSMVGPHRKLRSSYTKRSPESPLPSDEFRAMIEAERGTASLLFSCHTQPDAFWVRVLGTKMRAESHLFEPRLTVERLHGKGGPLNAFKNGRAIAKAEKRNAFRGLFRKLSGGPGAYEGLWELLRTTYSAIESKGPSPVSMEQIQQVNRLVADLTAAENQL